MRSPWLPLAAVMAASAFASGASAQAPAPLTYGQIRTMAPRDLAARLLRPDQVSDVERVESRSSMVPGTLEVRFFHRPVPLGRGYCKQATQSVGLATIMPRHSGPPADDEALRAGQAEEDDPIARAPGCRLHQGQQFASLNVDVDVGMRTLDSLAAAQAAAARRGRLPFRLSCRDEVDRDPDQCRPGARRVLAHLPLDHACLVDRPNADDPRVLEITLCADDAEWTLTMAGFGTRRARFAMLWENIPPF